MKTNKPVSTVTVPTDSSATPHMDPRAASDTREAEVTAIALAQQEFLKWLVGLVAAALRADTQRAAHKTAE